MQVQHLSNVKSSVSSLRFIVDLFSLMIQFFTGWWIILDIAALDPSNFNKSYYICGVFGTIALFMINVISNGQLRGDAFTDGCLGPRGSRMWLFIGFVMGFASLIAAGWILFASFVIPGKDFSHRNFLSS